MSRCKVIKFLFFSISYLNGQENKNEQLLKKCINKQVKEYSDFQGDVYSLANDIEELLIEKKALSKLDKEDYFKLLLSIQTDRYDRKTIYCELKDLYFKERFLLGRFSVNSAIYGACQKKIIKSKSFKNDEQFYERAKVLSEIMNHGFYNLKLFKKYFSLMDKENFKKLKYRIPTIFLVAINLDRKYDVNIQHMEKLRKGKKLIPTD